MRTVRLLIIMFLVATFISAVVPIARAGSTELLKGRLISVDRTNMSIVIEDKSGQKITVYFEDENVFSRIQRLKIEIGEKVSVRYIIKNGKKIGTYIRSLRGC